jgi:hypothetical protein
MPSRPHGFWKLLGRGLAVIFGLLLLLYAGLLGYLTFTQGQCRNEGRDRKGSKRTKEKDLCLSLFRELPFLSLFLELHLGVPWMP